jgi:thioester reductase-like protein
VLLEAETAKEHLGLPDDLYEEVSAHASSLSSLRSLCCQLRTSVTTVIHNAWRLDFNLALSSFESAIRGTRNLLDLAMTSPHAAHIRLFFTSSIAVTRSWLRTQGAFPEEPQADAKWCVGGGYGESKYVCEQVRIVSPRVRH